jgi:hypothetical protein
MEEILTLAFGIILRLGIPIGLTLLVIWILKQLDSRWISEAELSTAHVAVRTADQVPCWERKGCSEEKRANCPACKEPQVPCWQQFRSPKGLLKEECIGCEVFREAPIPVSG